MAGEFFPMVGEGVKAEERDTQDEKDRGEIKPQMPGQGRR